MFSESWQKMTLERKKNITARRQARTNHHHNNNNNTTSSATGSSSQSAGLSACASSPAAGSPRDSVTTENNNISCTDSVVSRKCLSSACDDENVDEPIDSHNTPSAINVLMSSTSSTNDQFANR